MLLSVTLIDFLPVKSRCRPTRCHIALMGVVSSVLLFIVLSADVRTKLRIPINFTPLGERSTYLDTAGNETERHEDDEVLCYTRTRFYKPIDVVSCLDGLHRERNETKTTDTNVGFRFAFIGDSRIRHQFISFLNLIPDYDMKKSYQNGTTKHDDRNVTSSLLNVHLSFHWRPMLGQDLFQTVENWLADDESTPDFVLIGLTIWHLIPTLGPADYGTFEKGILKLKPLLSSLAENTTVVWLKQYPTIELFGTINAHNTDVHNENVKEIFSDTRVKIWGSGNKAIGEYIRSCLLSKNTRQDKDSAGIGFGPSYFKCRDFCHPGQSALYQNTQEIFNYICNTCVQTRP